MIPAPKIAPEKCRLLDDLSQETDKPLLILMTIKTLL
jgi:hypothetical protein